MEFFNEYVINILLILISVLQIYLIKTGNYKGAADLEKIKQKNLNNLTKKNDSYYKKIDANNVKIAELQGVKQEESVKNE